MSVFYALIKLDVEPIDAELSDIAYDELASAEVLYASRDVETTRFYSTREGGLSEAVVLILPEGTLDSILTVKGSVL